MAIDLNLRKWEMLVIPQRDAPEFACFLFVWPDRRAVVGIDDRGVGRLFLDRADHFLDVLAAILARFEDFEALAERAPGDDLDLTSRAPQSSMRSPVGL